MGSRAHASGAHDPFIEASRSSSSCSSNSTDPWSVTWKSSLGKSSLGKQSFLQKSLENIEKQQNIYENIYKICAKSNNPRGRREAPPPWGAAEGGACCFWHICCIIFHICLAVFRCFPMIFAEKIAFPGPFCPGPFSMLPNYFPKQRFAVRGSYVAEKKEIGHGTAGNSSLRL